MLSHGGVSGSLANQPPNLWVSAGCLNERNAAVRRREKVCLDGSTVARPSHTKTENNWMEGYDGHDDDDHAEADVLSPLTSARDDPLGKQSGWDRRTGESPVGCPRVSGSASVWKGRGGGWG